MRVFLRYCVIVGLALAQPAMAQTYPVKPVRVIVPFAPGGSADGTARPIAERLGALLGQTFVVENRPGAQGVIGASMVAKADPDGYTLLLVPGTHVLVPLLTNSVPYHPLNDFTPVSNLVFAPYVIMSATNQPFTSLKDMVAYARENPMKLAIGNSEVTTRLAAESLSQAGNIKLTHVNYKGGGPIAADVLGGHLALGVATPVSVLAFHKDRKVNALAVTSPKRLGSMPDVPTVAEALGVAQFDSQTWFALAGPAGMPRPVVDRLSRAITQILAEPAIRERLLTMGLIPAEDSTPEGLGNLMKSFSQRNAVLIEAAKIKME
ncbi:MAG: tripartite tricarboxylate transporter substrate binding protein [Proteobacteria bacterium]|nr:tripartite tricarboxylate transporter substrate binding protein [Pseudomonadota bacterium]